MTIDDLIYRKFNSRRKRNKAWRSFIKSVHNVAYKIDLKIKYGNKVRWRAVVKELKEVI
ncbi:MAG: hypothetical protein WBP82_05680 [Leuconostoc mesenteroides]